jgi:hypothetical protein
MKARQSILLLTAGLSLCFPLSAAQETLHYSVNWPTGLSLGEATLSTDNLDSSSPAERNSTLRLEASIPTYAVIDEFQSRTSPAHCAIEFRKNIQHGKRAGQETLTFDAAAGSLERKTEKGGSSRSTVPACAKDALGFLYFLRSELRASRIPPPQPVYFGAAYQITLQHAGTQRVMAKGAPVEADKFFVTIQGPASAHKIEIYFARDAARTPVLFRVPLPLGAFTMELVD